MIFKGYMTQYYNGGGGGGGGGGSTTTTQSPFVPAQTSLNLDDPAVLTAGLLTLPTSATKYARYNMTGAAGPYSISKISGVPAYVIELRDTSAIQVVFTGTPESTASTNDLVIETPGTITLNGNGDTISFNNIAGEVFHRKVTASTYFD